jgi:hypothetical protein
MKVNTRKVISMPTQSRQAADRQTSDQQADKTTRQHSSTSSQHAVEPSGPKDDNPGTAGPGLTKVKSNTPENRLGHINPSAPEDSNTTPGTVSKK